MRHAPWVLLLLGGFLRGEVDRPAQPWKIDFTLSLAEKKGAWVFTVDGVTDLPADTVLRARVFVVTVVDHPFDGPREDDDEALIRGDDETRPSDVKFKAGSGRFREAVHAFARKPYSIRYRAKVFYLPGDQTDAITLKVGDQDFFRKADLRVGTEAAYETELKERLAEAAKDFMALERLAGELDGWVARAAAEPAAWIEWKGRALDATGAIHERNLHRFDLWAVWPEHQTRFRMEALRGYLERTVAMIDDREEEGLLRTRMRRLEGAFDDAYTTIGIDAPLDARRAAPVFEAYEKTVAPLRGGPDPAVRRRIRADGVAALYDLLRMIRTRHRAYVHVNTLSARLTRIFQLADAGAPREDLGRAVEAHDAALREFRAYAGLP